MKNCDKIHIRDLLARCIIGVFPHERDTLQDVIFNITLEAEYRRACLSDELDDTVDYKRLKKDILEMVEASDFQLIERLAEAVAEICLRRSQVQAVSVTVDKPGALRFARSVAVEIYRSRVDAG